jgi:hypothetical protein
VAATPASSPKWDATTADYHSAPNSYTDSKSGMYVANATVTMSSTNNISLTGYSNPILSFWTKWDIENSYDCGLIQISTNSGSTWISLKGTLSKSASGIGRQLPAGAPVYDGTLSTWTQETVDLTAYAGEQIKLRFALWTDEGLNKDGWYVDDISIFFYGTLPDPVKVESTDKIDFTLEQNYPNPFNPNTVIKYSIHQSGIVSIKLYNILGSEVATLLNEFKEAGRYSLNFSSDELKNKISSGVYFYTIKAGRFTQTRKMVIMK